MPRLFLSHAGDDTIAAREIARQLRDAGLDVWLDIDEIKPGDRWIETLEQAIAQADVFAVCVGRSGVARWVDREVRLALDRSARDSNFRIIPILSAGSDPAELPPFLSLHQWLDLRSGEVSNLKKLVGAVLDKPPLKASLLPPGQPPFRGLLAFDIDHALLFCGRDREVDELLSKLRSGSFIAVMGDSGSGKSSLVQAGLVPALHRGRFHDGASWGETWRTATFRPADDPFREMGSALPNLVAGLSAAEKIEVLETCRGQLKKGVEGLHNCVAALVPQRARALIVVDQFEELFALGPKEKEEERHRFVDSLLEAASAAGDHPVHIVITLRADFYSRCWDHPELLSRISETQYAVRRMDADQLREAVERPLALAGAGLEPGLADAILEDAGDEPGNLPLLEHALLQLWERRTGDLLTHEAYKEIGRLSGALARQADTVYERIPAGEERETARKVLLRLTQPGEGTADSRRRASKEELLALDGGTGVAERVLLELARGRLVTTENETSTAASQDTVDIAHEALILHWPRLRTWLDEDRNALRVERKLMAAAAEWLAAGPDRIDLLYRGVRLQEAETWARERSSDLTSDQRAFLEASVKARQEEVRQELERSQRLAAEAARRADAELQARRRGLYVFTLVTALVTTAAITVLLSQPIMRSSDNFAWKISKAFPAVSFAAGATVAAGALVLTILATCATLIWLALAVALRGERQSARKPDHL